MTSPKWLDDLAATVSECRAAGLMQIRLYVDEADKLLRIARAADEYLDGPAMTLDEDEIVALRDELESALSAAEEEDR